MVLKPTTIRPGLLVSLKTTLKGNVSYYKRDLDHQEQIEGVVDIWTTERLTRDKAEHERAVKARSKARACVTSVCAQSDYGLLCPQNREDQLDIALADAQRVAAEFNATAQHTQLTVFAVVGRVEQDDVRAIRAINDEVRGLLDEMQRGVANFDVEAIRAAANKARNVGQALNADAQLKLKDAIDAARVTARSIQKVVKAGEEASLEIDRNAIERIAQASVGFVDLDDATEISVPTSEGLGVDLGAELSCAPSVGVQALDLN